MTSRVIQAAIITLTLLGAVAAVSTNARPGTASTGPARLPKLESVTVSDINDRGEVVGVLRKEHDGATLGFAWKNGSLQLLGRGKSAAADLINDRGQILGTSGGHAVLWEAGSVTSVGLHYVWGLNEAGQVLGGNEVGNHTDGYTITPAVWTNGTVRPLPFAGWGGPMNNLGQVVGQTTDGHAAEWQDGTLTDLGEGYPTAINDHGDILGSLDRNVILWRNGAATILGPGLPGALNEHGEAILSSVHWPSHALLWRNGTMTDLGTLGGKWSIPTAISDSGQVVGYSTDSYGRQHGFVWRNGVMTRLPAPAGYRGSVTRALAMNDRNQIIGDNCHIGCGETRNLPPSRFAVLWTLRGHKIETRRLLDIRR